MCVDLFRHLGGSVAHMGLAFGQREQGLAQTPAWCKASSIISRQIARIASDNRSAEHPMRVKKRHSTPRRDNGQADQVITGGRAHTT